MHSLFLLINSSQIKLIHASTLLNYCVCTSRILNADDNTYIVTNTMYRIELLMSHIARILVGHSPIPSEILVGLLALPALWVPPPLNEAIFAIFRYSSISIP